MNQPFTIGTMIHGTCIMLQLPLSDIETECLCTKTFSRNASAASSCFVWLLTTLRDWKIAAGECSFLVSSEFRAYICILVSLVWHPSGCFPVIILACLFRAVCIRNHENSSFMLLPNPIQTQPLKVSRDAFRYICIIIIVIIIIYIYIYICIHERLCGSLYGI